MFITRRYIEIYGFYSMSMLRVLVRSVNGSFAMNSLHLWLCVFLISLMFGTNANGIKWIVCLCACVVFVFLQLLNMDGMPSAVLPSFKTKNTRNFSIKWNRNNNNNHKQMWRQTTHSGVFKRKTKQISYRIGTTVFFRTPLQVLSTFAVPDLSVTCILR